ncbi:hypothetical protein [Mobiluncus curtisii]|uniref:hypothetical protein n=1 Tax=Mobiluncus curtisii TaxID=2051 RepID=UPI00146FF79B|nr:hypothetical protein [Mobiluncus curtisii]NMW48996.1 hypothetical protein [Mobiluncus curtisii]NMW89111.1 hypothetical protein [Mobiluncus curtisii]
MGVNPKTQKRQPKGTSKGGQFAPEQHETTPNDLDEAPFGQGSDTPSLAELAQQEPNLNGRQVIDALVTEPVGSKKREQAKKLYIASINRNLIDEDRKREFGYSEDFSYGETGWTNRILPYTLDYSDFSTQYCAVGENYTGQDVIGTNFTEFKQADAALAQRLLDTVPGKNLKNERQNEAPTVGNILEFVNKHPSQAGFGGHVVSGERADERLSVDTVSVSPELLGLDEDATEDDAREKLHGLKLGETSRPDETRWDENQNRWNFRWY